MIVSTLLQTEWRQPRKIRIGMRLAVLKAPVVYAGAFTFMLQLGAGGGPGQEVKQGVEDIQCNDAPLAQT